MLFLAMSARFAFLTGLWHDVRMGPKPQAVLAGYVLGLACVGIGLPSLVSLIGQVVGVTVASLGLPDNPGESGYLILLPGWIAGVVSGSFELIFNVYWLTQNAPRIALLVFGALLLTSRPRWFIRKIGRCTA